MQYFFVLAGHMVEEMIVYFFIKFLIFVDLVFTQVDRVISHIFHDKLGVFIEMLFVGGCGAGFISFGHDYTLAIDIYGSGQPGCFFGGSGYGCILSLSGSLSFFSLIIHSFHFWIHYFKKLIVGFIINIFLDDKCI